MPWNYSWMELAQVSRYFTTLLGKNHDHDKKEYLVKCALMTPTFYQSLYNSLSRVMSLPNLILVALTVLAANAHQLRGNNQQFDISSACPINGNWAANADVCQQVYIRSQQRLVKTCNRNHRFTFVTHPDGTLQGTKSYVDSLTGDIRLLDLIPWLDFGIIISVHSKQ